MAQEKYDIFDLGYGKELDRAVIFSEETSSSSSLGDYSGGLVDTLSEVAPPAIISSGALTSTLEQSAGVLFNGKTTFTDTTNGYRFGVDLTDNTFKFVMGTTGSMIDWNVTTANTLTIQGTLTATAGTIGGWTISSTTLANSTNIILDSSNKAISVNSATFGSDGVQIQYNAGNPRMYIGDGSNQFFKFDGSTISWGAVNTTLSAAGLLTTTSATIGGWSVVDGYIYNLGSGTPTSSPNNGIVLASGNEALIVYEGTSKRVEVGYLSSGVYGIKGYATDGSTVIFELSDSQQTIATGVNLGSTDVVIVEGQANAIWNKITSMGNRNDGFTETLNLSGTITRYVIYSVLATGATSGGQARLSRISSPNAGTIINWGNDYEFTVNAKLSATSAQDIGLYISEADSVPNGGVLVSRHFGFIVDDAILYATNANGTTQTTTDISSGITLTDWHTYRVVFDADANVKFYVDDVLKATHTTNRPSGTDIVYVVLGIANTAAANKELYICNNYVESVVI